MLLNEAKFLNNSNILELIAYIKSSIDTIVSIKVDEELTKYKSNDNENTAQNYETLLRKEEASIRQHIATEQQLKLHLEKMSEKLEQYELNNRILMNKLVSYIIFLTFFIKNFRKNKKPALKNI